MNNMVIRGLAVMCFGGGIGTLLWVLLTFFGVDSSLVGALSGGSGGLAGSLMVLWLNNNK